MRLAVIPARGGSQRIPRKNIRLFAGRPIIAYSIEAALGSGLFERVMVSTDDMEIAEVALTYGAEIPFMRPSSLADAHTGTHAVVRQAVQWHLDHGQPVEHACCIYATAPFVRAPDLSDAYKMLVDSDKSFVFSVTQFDFPVQRALSVNTRGEVNALYPQYRETRSQDLESTWHDAGQFYWGTAKAWLDDDVLFSPVSLGYTLPSHRVQDIDSETDWRRAELLFELLLRDSELA